MPYFSKRSLNLLENPQYKKAKLTSDENLFIVTGDKKLTVNYFEMESKLHNLLGESLSILLNSRATSRILEISFKELDSFLRDDNSSEALDTEGLEQLKLLFEEAKSQLVSCWLKTNINEIPALNFISKLNFANEIFQLLDLNFDLKKQYQFIHFEHEFIYFLKSPKVKQSYIETGLLDFFKTSLDKNIKLVAVKG